MAGISDVGDSEKKLTQIQRVRRSIDAERLIRKLNSCIFGRTKLRADQQFAIKTQLNKVMPDLQAVEFRGEIEHNVIASEPLSSSDWLSRHGSVSGPESGAGEAQVPGRTIALEAGDWFEVGSETRSKSESATNDQGVSPDSSSAGSVVSAENRIGKPELT